MNQRNFGIVEGRLTRDPYLSVHKDGSRKVLLTIAARDNFGEKNTQFVGVAGFIPKEKTDNGVYDKLHQGDLVGIQYSVRSSNWTDANGQPRFDQELMIESIDFKETKAVTTARAARKAGEAAAATEAEAEA